MEVMDIDEVEIVELELKYCERCGALSLRPQGSEQVYCRACAIRMLDLPIPRKSRGYRRLPLSRDSRHEQSRHEVVALEGGRA